MASRYNIFSSYPQTFESEEDKIRHNQSLFALLHPSNAKLTPLNYYHRLLKENNESDIDCLDQEGKIKLRRSLYITYLLLLQAQQTGQKHPDSIKKCERLLDYLDLKKNEKESPLTAAVQSAHDGHPVAYLGIQAGQWFGQKMLDTIDRTATITIDKMSAANEYRLYWVWGGGLLKTVLSLIPDTFLDTQNARTAVSAPDRFTGYVSWILYYARFSLNVFLLLKNTFSPALTEKEKASDIKKVYWERFITQWNMRKFVLLNDFLWGIANMVCFLWLGGSSGDLLTEGLLLFDLSSSLWQFQEEQTQYNKRMLEYTIIIDRLKDTFSHEKNSEIKKLEREKNKCHRDWEHKKLGLINNSVYALALIITFALSALPFLPVTVPALLIISVVGTVLCFTITVINNAIRNGLEIRRACLSSKEAKMDLKQKIADFKELVEENGDFNDYKIILFLEIKQLRAETEHQQQMITYQTMHFIRSLVIQSLIPTLLFVSFVFLPVGIGIPVVGAGFLLAIVSYLLIERNFKPEQVTSFAFDSEEYQEFCNDPDSWDKIPSVATQSLFKVEAKPGERDKNSPSSPDENTLLPDNNMS